MADGLHPGAFKQRVTTFVGGDAGAWRFEYAPEHADAFEHLVERLRATDEWRHITRELDIRLSRCHAKDA